MGHLVILVNCVDDLPGGVVPGAVVVFPKTIDFFIPVVTAVETTETKVWCLLAPIFPSLPHFKRHIDLCLLNLIKLKETAVPERVSFQNKPNLLPQCGVSHANLNSGLWPQA